MGSHSTLRAHFDALIIVLDTLPKEYYKLLILLVEILFLQLPPQTPLVEE